MSIAIFTLTGCNSDIIVQEEKKENNSSCTLTKYNDFLDEDDFTCEEIKDAIDIGENFFITKDGDFYELSTDKKYSTNSSNCRKVKTSLKFKKIVRNTLISTDETFYRMDNTTGTIIKIAEEQQMRRGDYGINQMDIQLYKEYNDMFFLSVDSVNEIYRVIRNNNVYLIESGELNSEPVYKFDDNESVERLTNGYIATNKAYYKYGLVNEKQYQEYADIKCEYGIVKIDSRDNCNNVILASNNLIVTDKMVK